MATALTALWPKRKAPPQQASNPLDRPSNSNASGAVSGYNPYLAGRKEWDERYGDLISRAKHWRVAAFLAMGVALAAVGGLIAVSMRSRVVPWIVAVDNLDRIVASGAAEQTSVADDRLKRAALNSWISDLRTVTSDFVAQRRMIDRVYAMVGAGTPGQVQISDYYRLDPPNQRAQTQTVEVEIHSIFSTTETTYLVEWTERTRALAGQVLKEERWKGAFALAINPPKDEQLIRVNPLGLYVTNVSWSKVL
ncbi:MAG: conjugal transfer protein TrbF [Acidobacteriales bacterium]|nr:conjugal transfer protein TrbF [Terriglobales bacterium]